MNWTILNLLVRKKVRRTHRPGISSQCAAVRQTKRGRQNKSVFGWFSDSSDFSVVRCSDASSSAGIVQRFNHNTSGYCVLLWLRPPFIWSVCAWKRRDRWHSHKNKCCVPFRCARCVGALSLIFLGCSLPSDSSRCALHWRSCQTDSSSVRYASSSVSYHLSVRSALIISTCCVLIVYTSDFMFFFCSAVATYILYQIHTHSAIDTGEFDAWAVPIQLYAQFSKDPVLGQTHALFVFYQKSATFDIKINAQKLKDNNRINKSFSGRKSSGPVSCVKKNDNIFFPFDGDACCIFTNNNRKVIIATLCVGDELKISYFDESPKGQRRNPLLVFYLIVGLWCVAVALISTI